MLQCAISVDLDEIPNYAAIHGVELDFASRNAVHDIAVGRLMEWAERHALPLTLFTVGSDLQREAVRKNLKDAVQAGHEIANHSQNHCYDLTRLSREKMREEVLQAADAIEAAVGVRPRGFRAPGYTTTDTLYDVLSELGVSYSSSVFPCPPYYGLKVAAIAWKALRGHPSHSIIDTPRVLTAPRVPYRVGKPYFTRGNGLLELPMQVTPGLRLPWIGTSLTLGPLWLVRWMTWQLLGTPFLNLELHGIDVLDRRDGLEALVPFQPDVRVALERKLRALDTVVGQLKRFGYQFVTLEQAAKTQAAQLPQN